MHCPMKSRAGGTISSWPLSCLAVKTGRTLLGLLMSGRARSLEASEQQFLELIAQRNSKAREILKHFGKPVTVENIIDHSRAYLTIGGCNQYWVTVHGQGPSVRCIPLEFVEVGFDYQRQTLKLHITRTLRS